MQPYYKLLEEVGIDLPEQEKGEAVMERQMGLVNAKFLEMTGGVTVPKIRISDATRKASNSMPAAMNSEMETELEKIGDPAIARWNKSFEEQDRLRDSFTAGSAEATYVEFQRGRLEWEKIRERCDQDLIAMGVRLPPSYVAWWHQCASDVRKEGDALFMEAKKEKESAPNGPRPLPREQLIKMLIEADKKANARIPQLARNNMDLFHQDMRRAIQYACPVETVSAVSDLHRVISWLIGRIDALYSVVPHKEAWMESAPNINRQEYEAAIQDAISHLSGKPCAERILDIFPDGESEADAQFATTDSIKTLLDKGLKEVRPILLAPYMSQQKSRRALERFLDKLKEAYSAFLQTRFPEKIWLTQLQGLGSYLSELCFSSRLWFAAAGISSSTGLRKFEQRLLDWIQLLNNVEWKKIGDEIKEKAQDVESTIADNTNPSEKSETGGEASAEELSKSLAGILNAMQHLDVPATESLHRLAQAAEAHFAQAAAAALASHGKTLSSEEFSQVAFELEKGCRMVSQITEERLITAARSGSMTREEVSGIVSAALDETSRTIAVPAAFKKVLEGTTEDQKIALVRAPDDDTFVIDLLEQDSSALETTVQMQRTFRAETADREHLQKIASMQAATNDELQRLFNLLTVLSERAKMAKTDAEKAEHLRELQQLRMLMGKVTDTVLGMYRTSLPSSPDSK